MVHGCPQRTRRPKREKVRTSFLLPLQHQAGSADPISLSTQCQGEKHTSKITAATVASYQPGKGQRSCPDHLRSIINQRGEHLRLLLTFPGVDFFVCPFSQRAETSKLRPRLYESEEAGQRLKVTTLNQHDCWEGEQDGSRTEVVRAAFGWRTGLLGQCPLDRGD